MYSLCELDAQEIGSYLSSPGFVRLAVVVDVAVVIIVHFMEFDEHIHIHRSILKVH